MSHKLVELTIVLRTKVDSERVLRNAIKLLQEHNAQVLPPRCSSSEIVEEPAEMPDGSMISQEELAAQTDEVDKLVREQAKDMAEGIAQHEAEVPDDQLQGCITETGRVSDNYVMPFGKHIGKPMGEVPGKYLDWLRGQSWIGKWEWVLAYIEQNSQHIDAEVGD